MLSQQRRLKKKERNIKTKLNKILLINMNLKRQEETEFNNENQYLDEIPETLVELFKFMDEDVCMEVELDYEEDNLKREDSLKTEEIINKEDNIKKT